MRRDKLEHTQNVRLDTETLHALERLVAKRNEARAQMIKEQDARKGAGRPYRIEHEIPKSAFTVSDVIRHAIRIGLSIWESNNDDEIRDWAGGVIERDVMRILASGYHDTEAMTLLQRIASKSAPDPDFG